MKKQIEYIKENYNEISHYDLAMSLLCDQFTDDLDELKEMVNGFFGTNDNEAIEEAYTDALG